MTSRDSGFARRAKGVEYNRKPGWREMSRRLSG
jgi:hypothetical protein